MATTGKVYLQQAGKYEWEIEDFLSFCEISSPHFYFKDVKLCMYVFVSEVEDRLQIAIQNTNFYSGKLSRDLYVQLSMNANERQEVRSGTFDRHYGELQFRKWMPWTEMLRRRSRILRHGCLIIRCSVKEVSQMVLYPRTNLAPSKPETVIESEAKSELDISPIDKANLPDEKEDSDQNSEGETHPQSKGVRDLLKALRSMLTTEEDSDVVINVRGKEFRAHRGILRARSSVFNSMFSHDMLEKKSDAVKISDCDPETFTDFLDHIYTGSFDVISKKNVFCLYKASDKYDIEALKEECVEYMKKNLTVDCFCSVITLAVKHDEKELIELATEFFCVNSLNIIKTVEWQTFLNENATVGNELFIKLLSK